MADPNKATWYHYLAAFTVIFLTLIPLIWKMWGWSIFLFILIIVSILTVFKKEEKIDLQAIVSSWWFAKLFFVLAWLTAFLIYLDFTTGGAQ